MGRHRQTECQRGHLLTPENMAIRYRDGREERSCKVCAQILAERRPEGGQGPLQKRPYVLNAASDRRLSAYRSKAEGVKRSSICSGWRSAMKPEQRLHYAQAEYEAAQQKLHGKKD